MNKHSIKWNGGNPVVICDGQVVLALPDELFTETRRRASSELRAGVGAAMGCLPSDDDDLIEAVRLLVGERDAAVARAKELQDVAADLYSSALPNGLRERVKALEAAASLRVKELESLLGQRCDGFDCDRGEECVTLTKQLDAANADRVQLRLAILQGADDLGGLVPSAFAEAVRIAREGTKP